MAMLYWYACISLHYLWKCDPTQEIHIDLVMIINFSSCANFELTFVYIMYKNSVKSCARLKRKKSQKLAVRKKFHEIIARNVKGGGGRNPPPALLGLSHSPFDHAWEFQCHSSLLWIQALIHFQCHLIYINIDLKTVYTATGAFN